MTDKKTAQDTSKEVMSNSFIIEKMKGAASLKDEFSADQLKFIKNLLNPDLTDTELYMFMALCGRIKLDPFNREIIAIVYGKNNPSDRKVNYIVTRDGKRVVASRQGGFEDMVTEVIYTKKITGENKTENTVKVQAWEGGSLWGATCTITRSGQKHTVIVPFSEYNTGKNVWASKPSTMIRKVAESQALSAAFPEILGGLYDESEMPQNELPDVISDNGTPATPEQLETIKNMGGELVEGLTKVQAAQTIKNLVNKK